MYSVVKKSYQPLKTIYYYEKGTYTENTAIRDYRTYGDSHHARHYLVHRPDGMTDRAKNTTGAFLASTPVVTFKNH